MTTEKFTPGEWRVTYHSRMRHVKDWYEIYSIYGAKKIAVVDFSDDSDGKTEEANASLIEAAPEMYAVLKMIADTTTFMGSKTDETLRIAIDAILKKARGEE